MIHSPEHGANLNSPDQVRVAVERLTVENVELRQMNAILSRSNQDFERFAFAGSHDLHEPLRAITAYAELLEKNYESERDEEFAMFVGNIVQGAKRMRTLLGDLLAYAEIGAISDDSGEVVDLNLVLEKVRHNLQMSIEETGASVVSTELPVFICCSRVSLCTTVSKSTGQRNQISKRVETIDPDLGTGRGRKAGVWCG